MAIIVGNTKARKDQINEKVQAVLATNTLEPAAESVCYLLKARSFGDLIKRS